MKLVSTISLAALAFSASAALAADLPARKAAPMLPPPPPPMWTGFYAGLNAGYGFGGGGGSNTTGYEIWNQYAAMTLGPRSATMTNTGNVGGLGWATTGYANQNQNGFIGGAQFGYNYQYGQNIVLGVETDIQGTGIRGGGGFTGLGQNNVYHTYNDGRRPIWHSETTFAGSGNVQSGLDFLGTVRGRIGYLVTPSLLVYGTAGFSYGGAWAKVNTSGNNNYVPWAHLTGPHADPTTSGSYAGQGSGSGLLTGWNAGGGFEWMFMQNWSAKAEAFYYDLGNMTVQGTGFQAAALPNTTQANAIIYNTTTSVRYNGIVARAGINYHFNWGGSAPILAKY